jgi:tRNA dimethylallyltransferase
MALSQAPIYIIVGSTATGKTDLAIALAQQLGCSVLSADSQQVYEGLSIGTAKPTLAEQAGVTHYGLDLVPPTQGFSVANYTQYALPLLVSACQQNKSLIIAGGTGFYLQPLLQQHRLPTVASNPALRQQLLADAAKLNPSSPSTHLHQKLAQLDPERAMAISPKDLVRVLRALEIVITTGKPVSKALQPSLLEVDLQEAGLTLPPIHWVGLRYEQTTLLWHRIEQRIGNMLEAGWLQEVEALVASHGAEAHALQVAHGYPELLAVLQGTRSLEDAQQQIKINVRQYARRQRIWFSKNPSIGWVDVSLHATPQDQLKQLCFSGNH